MQAQRAIKDLTERENQLKEQLNIYTAKYDDFQQSLQKSNEVFGSYKIELEKMSKHTKKIEKEALAWRQKYEKANAMVIDLATEKQLSSQHSDRLQKQIQQLQKLLRALQQERTTLHKSLRDNNIEIPALPQLPPEPEPVTNKPTQENVKMEMMSRNCAELKQTLANLQNQMKLLTATESKTALEEKNKAAEEQRQANNAKKNNRKKEKSQRRRQQLQRPPLPHHPLQKSSSAVSRIHLHWSCRQLAMQAVLKRPRSKLFKPCQNLRQFQAKTP